MDQLKYPIFTAVVPSYNEDPRFVRVITELLKIPHLDELIFVDDGSTDNTKETVKQFLSDKRFHYVRHSRNKGKGEALHTGVRHAKNEVILFLDADLANITSQKITKIVKPVMADLVDMARGSFTRKRGRVTEYAVKPMMQILFPRMYFKQPITGQICAKRSFLINAEYKSRYGVDIGLLFDAIEQGQRIVEVDIGRLTHKANSHEITQQMSEQVLETMIERAGLIRHKYKFVLFTLDNTLVYPGSFRTMFAKLGIEEQLLANHQLMDEGALTAAEYLERNAELFKGMKTEDFEALCSTLPIARYATEVIRALIRRKYKVGIISSQFSPIVKSFADRLGADYWSGVDLEERGGKYTGVIKKRSSGWLVDHFDQGFKNAFQKAVRSQGVKPTETIMVAGNERSLPILKLAGLGIAYKPKHRVLKEVADKTIHLHAELLALIE